jgi:molybdopterin converting factor subunit 1
MRILFFAQVRDAAGCPQVEWKDVVPMNASAVWDRLIREFPALAGHRQTTRLARNGAYVEEDESFEKGDEVALIPPVSGG